MDRIRTPALVARLVDYGEADRVCTLLARSHGKVSALARGARRSRRRFGGALSLFVVGEATLRPPRRGELYGLERFDAVEDLGSHIAEDVVKLGHGSYLLELTRELWPAAQPEPTAFDLLLAALRSLAGRPPAPALLRAYELQLLGAVGLAPSLDRCVVCGLPPSGPVRINVARGGVLCAGCGDGLPLAPATHQLLQQLQRAPLHAAAALPASVEAAREARNVTLLVLRHVLGKDLRSVEFLLKMSSRLTVDR
jgi:DNA repair protein RecO (recombination protein O)